MPVPGGAQIVVRRNGQPGRKSPRRISPLFCRDAQNAGGIDAERPYAQKSFQAILALFCAYFQQGMTVA